jgi:hypothetical protein
MVMDYKETAVGVLTQEAAQILDGAIALLATFGEVYGTIRTM